MLRTKTPSELANCAAAVGDQLDGWLFCPGILLLRTMKHMLTRRLLNWAPDQILCRGIEVTDEETNTIPSPKFGIEPAANATTASAQLQIGTRENVGEFSTVEAPGRVEVTKLGIPPTYNIHDGF
jgi:hypothetical protein